MHTGKATSGIYRLQPATICSQPATMRFYARSARALHPMCAAPTHLCCIRVVHPLALPAAQRLIVGQTPSHSAAQGQAKHTALLDQQAWQQVRPGLMRAFCCKANGRVWHLTSKPVVCPTTPCTCGAVAPGPVAYAAAR